MGSSPATQGYSLKQGRLIKLLRHDVREWIDDRRVLRFRDELRRLCRCRNLIACFSLISAMPFTGMYLWRREA